jgi:hypothetical protein
MTLPAAADATHPIVIFRSGANAVVVDGNGAETINGSATYTITENNRAVGFVSDGSNWKTYGTPTTKLSDADGDTLVQVEESADEDVIRFDTGGTERHNIDASGINLAGTSGVIGRYSYGAFDRAKFEYNGGTTAYTVKVNPAMYLCKDKYCWWDAVLTTGAIGTPAADTWYYLYLDYSEITSGERDCGR